MVRRLATVAVLLVIVISSYSFAKDEYKILETFKLGGDGGWDYLFVDTDAPRVFIARATRVMVVDTATGKLLKEIPDTPGVHGTAIAPELHRGFISVGRADKVVAFDTNTLEKVGEIKTGQNPDAILFEPLSGRVFSFNGRSHDATVMDPAKLEAVGTIALGGKPEFAVANGKGMVYVNIEDTSELVELDATKLTVTHRWDLKPCEEPTGLAMDQKHRRLFSVCGNKQMAIVNADTGKVIDRPAIGSGVDGVSFDPDHGVIASANGEGTMTLIHEDSPDKYTVIASVPTQRGARTTAFDPHTKRFLTVSADFGPPSAAAAENPRPRPSIKPDTFVLIEVGKGKAK